MLFQGRRRTMRVRQRGPFIRAALDENRHDRRGNVPTELLRSVIQKAAVPFGCGEQLNMLEALEIHPQAARIFQKQLRMRAAGNEFSGLFLVQIFCKASPNCRYWTAHVRAAHQYWEVAYIRRIFLLEMMMETLFRNPPGCKDWPGPM